MGGEHPTHQHDTNFDADTHNSSIKLLPYKLELTMIAQWFELTTWPSKYWVDAAGRTTSRVIASVVSIAAFLVAMHFYCPQEAEKAYIIGNDIVHKCQIDILSPL